MQRTGRLQNTLTSSSPQSKPAFNVVTAYEDLETGKHARQTYDYLVQHLGQDSQFSNEMWNFDVLCIPRLRELAAQDATRADIILIACHGTAPLPEGVKAWIESWLTQELKAIALVALFDSPHDASVGTEKIRDYLANVARAGNMEFFAQTDPWPCGQRLPSILPPVAALPSHEVDPRFSASMEFRQRYETFRHGGINE